jgi:hypothetical protein
MKGGELMDTRAKLYWADGRVQTIEHLDVDPTASIVQFPTPDGHYHPFEATDRIEDDCDVFVEQASS